MFCTRVFRCFVLEFLNVFKSFYHTCQLVSDDFFYLVIASKNISENDKQKPSFISVCAFKVNNTYGVWWSQWSSVLLSSVSVWGMASLHSFTHIPDILWHKQCHDICGWHAYVFFWLKLHIFKPFLMSTRCSIYNGASILGVYILLIDPTLSSAQVLFTAIKFGNSGSAVSALFCDTRDSHCV